MLTQRFIDKRLSFFRVVFLYIEMGLATVGAVVCWRSTWYWWGYLTSPEYLPGISPIDRRVHRRDRSARTYGVCNTSWGRQVAVGAFVPPPKPVCRNIYRRYRTLYRRVVMNLPLVLFDGVCNLCNKSVIFIIKRDVRKNFKFAPMQSSLG